MERLPTALAGLALILGVSDGVLAQSTSIAAPRQVRSVVEREPTSEVEILPVLHVVAQPARVELPLDALVQEVLARNPSLAQMVAAWQAASARYPQVRSWDDPMLMGAIAPASFGSNSVEAGYRVEVSQKIPFPGKLPLRGQAALSEASAANHEVEDMRVQLVEATRLAFFDYYLADRAIEVSEQNLTLLRQYRDSAETQYKNGQVPQQDVVQAEVEIGRQQERALTLERMRKVAVARINTLRALPPGEILPPPPRSLPALPDVPDAESLRGLALSRRADLRALEDRIAAEQAALCLARREYWPDAEIAAGYDTIMGNGPARDLAPQVAVRLNIPLALGKRNAAVAEACARIAQKRAELAARVNQVSFQVQEAYEQLVESRRMLELYEKTMLPKAEQNVNEALKAYVNGKAPFLSLIEAQRNLTSMRDRRFEIAAEQARRQATLERVVGGVLPAMVETAPPKRAL